MKHYFEYGMMTCCGISKVRLEGKLEDWVQLREATEKLNRYGLEWWTKNLIPILDKFIKAY